VFPDSDAIYTPIDFGLQVIDGFADPREVRFSQREEEERLNNSLRVIFTESNPLGAQTA
jgi:hypothetical protein